MASNPPPRRWAAPIPLDPKNPLEVMLVKRHKGELDEKTFERNLMTLSVYVATDDVDAADRSREVSPIVLSWANGQYVAVFSWADRVAKLVEEGGGSVQMLFYEVLERVPEGMGIVINPNLGEAVDFSPEKVAELRAEFLTTDN